MNKNSLVNRVKWIEPVESVAEKCDKELNKAKGMMPRSRYNFSSAATPQNGQVATNITWGYYQSPSSQNLSTVEPMPTEAPEEPIRMIVGPSPLIDHFVMPEFYAANGANSAAEVTQYSDDSDSDHRRRLRTKKPKLFAKWTPQDDPAVLQFKGTEEFRSMSVFPVFEDFQDGREIQIRPNVVKGRYADVNDYLDIQFRLLREDFIHPIREVVQKIVHDGVDSARAACKDVFVYKDVHLLYPPTVSKQGRLVYKVQLDSRSLGFVRWETSKRLIFGSLVCLSRDNFRTIAFATVFERDLSSLSRGQISVSFEGKLFNVADDFNDPTNSFIMVESTAYFEAYRHVLKALQATQSEDFPMEPYLINCKSRVQPPFYMERKRKQMSFACLMKNPSEEPPGVDVLDPNSWPTADQLDLDDSQYAALQTALTCELALIQGPPGTGKTFIGYKIVEFLLANNVVRSKRPPILIVCYTNHALDQFLVGIAEFMPEGIVRVGGRCQEEKLDRFLLENVMRGNKCSRGQWGRRRELIGELETEQIRLDLLVEELKMCSSAVCTLPLLEKFIPNEQLNYFLQRNPSRMSVMGQWLTECKNEFTSSPVATFGDLPPMNRRSARQMQREESELFDAQLEDINRRMVDLDVEDELPKRKGKPPMIQWSNFQLHNDATVKSLLVGESMSAVEAASVKDVWKLIGMDRWRLYRYWLGVHKQQLSQMFRQSQERYMLAADKLQDLRNLEKLDILRSAKVVGMTTTGAAIHQGILQLLRPRVVIIEEAAEVLEAHIVTSLTPALQHLLLIGDHKQLRPSPCVYDLAVKFNLEISLFERLVMNRFHRTQLQYQHRMRPEICDALMPHFYGELKSHASVYEKPPIRGLDRSFYFINHSKPEEGESDSMSKRNYFEADFLVHICLYLLQQDYPTGQITILSPYLGQVSLIRRMITARKDEQLSQVRVTAVDNFQGEESEIILLSLVRSNGLGKIGFLKIPNRCCVALSRAKSGFFVIGNFNHFRSASPLWEKICSSVEAQNALGTSLTVTCKKHQVKGEIDSPELFHKLASEGGCHYHCNVVLSCGHTCVRMCHPSDAEHQRYQCQVLVSKEWPDCHHTAMVSCHTTMKISNCPKECGAKLECGHSCKGTCGECKRGRVHLYCNEKCRRSLVCGHYCQAECGRPCPPCQLFCDNGCPHSSCSQTSVINGVKQNVTGLHCSDPCVSCDASCTTSCLHARCFKKCRDVCETTAVCSVKCGKRLHCSHMCAGLCGQPCPPLCAVCDLPILPKLKLKAEVIKSTTAEVIAKSPLIQLEDCGHIVPAKVVDAMMDRTGYFGPVRRVRCLRDGCSVVVRRSTRYKRSIQMVNNVVEQVKRKCVSLSPHQLESIRREVVHRMMDLTHNPKFLPFKALLSVPNFLPIRAKRLESFGSGVLSLEMVTKVRNAVKVYEIIVAVYEELMLKSEALLKVVLPVAGLKDNLHSLLKKLIFTHLPKEECDDLNTAFSQFLLQESVSLMEWIRTEEDHFNGSLVEPFLSEVRRYQLICRFAHVWMMMASTKKGSDLSPGDLEVLNKIVDRYCYGTTRCGVNEFETYAKYLKKIGDKYDCHAEFISRTDELSLETTPSFAESSWLYCAAGGHVFYKDETPNATECPTCNG